MANKLLVGMLLCSTMAFSQLVKVEVKTDSLASVLYKKDKRLNMLTMQAVKKNYQVNKLREKIDSLEGVIKKQALQNTKLQLFYDKAKKHLHPRIITKLEN